MLKQTINFNLSTPSLAWTSTRP